MRSLELTSVQLSHQRAYRLNSSGEIAVKKSPRDDSRGTNEQPNKSCPKGIANVGDRRARHVDAIKLGCGGIYKAPPRISLTAAEERELEEKKKKGQGRQGGPNARPSH